MHAATGDPTDQRRLVELERYQVLDRPPAAGLVALVEIAAQIAGVPMATINLITDTEQHQVAATGFEASICAREDSMCAAVLDAPRPVIVPDARADRRFADNPFVTGEIGHVRFYAAHQLVPPQGVPIGTLCVFDVQPRQLDDRQARALAQLANRVVDVLELELRTRELGSTVRDLEGAQAELRRSNEQLAAFAGQVSHDLRNPLAAVQMSVGLLASQDPTDVPADPARRTFLLNRAVRATSRMQALIDDLLSFARVGGELARLPVDLDRVLAEVVEDLAVPLAGATLRAEPLPTVVGDPVQLRAVLQNLVANAAKFTRPGEAARIGVTAHRTDDAWCVEVCDHGPGVPEEDRSRVFEPLARVDTSVDGSGIGLTTCRRIVEAHGGRIGLREAPSGGTCAWFELPV